MILRPPGVPDAHLPQTYPGCACSPWLDSSLTPQAEVYARLAAQPHRRIIKTHTPLDGIPLDRRATFIVVARDPLDQAVSLYHQSHNLDRDPDASAHPAAAAPAPTEQAAHDDRARLAGVVGRLGRPSRRADGCTARSDVASLRRLVPPGRAKRGPGPLRRSVGGPRSRDAPSGRTAGHCGGGRSLGPAGPRGPVRTRCGTGPGRPFRTRRGVSGSGLGFFAEGSLGRGTRGASLPPRVAHLPGPGSPASDRLSWWRRLHRWDRPESPSA